MKGKDATKDQLIEELRQSEENYRSIFVSSPYGIITIDLKGFVTSINPAFAKLTGYSKEEFLGKHFSKTPTANKRDIPKYLKLFASLVLGKKLKSPIELTWIHKDGTQRLGEHHYSFLRSRGKLRGIQAIARDITERKRAEEKLRESEFKYATLVEKATDGIAVIQNEICVFTNPAYEKITGYSLKELSAENFIDTLMPESKNILLERHRARVAGKRVSDTYEAKFKRKDGEIREGVLSSTTIDYQGKPASLVIARDITDRKHAEKALRESEEKYRSLFSRARDGIVIVDRGTGSIADCNPEYERQTGRTCKQLKSMKIWEIKPPDMVQKTKAQFFKIKEQGSGGSTESTYLRPDGTILPYEFSATSINIKGKRYLYGITRDISERKQLEEQHQKAAKLESVGILAGGIAHDFNNLLTGIMGNISLAKRNLERGELDKVSARLEDAERASMRSKDLTQQLLTFARGGLPIKKLIDLKGLIEESVTFALRGSNIKPVFSIQDDLSAVEADEGQINQVISNLIINANEAMPDGGRVEVGARNVSTEEMSASLLPEGDYIEISVKDHGIGISEKHMGKIFDPYFSTKQKGSGLGLATAYSIIKNHGGDVTVESKLGVGTTFCIYLPASKKRLTAKKAAATKTPLTDIGRILVMDDENIIRRLLHKMLTGIGHEVVLSNDGAEAIKLYKQAQISEQPFDVVILDLTVPGGMGGKETIKELLEIDPEVKAIVSSGYATDPIMAEFKKYGFKGVVTKPYNITQLEETLHKLLRKTK